MIRFFAAFKFLLGSDKEIVTRVVSLAPFLV